MGKNYRNHSKTARSPKRPFEKERLDAEMKLIGQFGLKNKREVWRVQYLLAKLRAGARHLLTLEPHDETRIFQGAALLRRLKRLGILQYDQNRLDDVLAVTPSDLLTRRLQSRVYHLGHARSIHHARCLILQRHIRVGRQIVTSPSFMVRMDSEKHIDFAQTSPHGGGRPGRVKRKKDKRATAGAEEEDE